MKSLTAKELINEYLNFFKEKGHTIIPSAPLVPEGDASTLFISAGIQPFVPYFTGADHPAGKRLTSVQKCLRTEDLEGVGDKQRHTFFQMLGNWSLGDYFKKESLSWSYEFITKVLQIDPKILHVTVFKGDDLVPFDTVAKETWLSLGIPEERIYAFGKEENWWEVGEIGPGGPDSEIYIDTGKEPCGENCNPSCRCGKYFEIWNNVFIEFYKNKNGSYTPLPKKNIDTGMGVERTIAILQGVNDTYKTEILFPIVETVEALSSKKYGESAESDKSIRIITDHLRAATFAISDGVVPSNSEQGYVVRRLIRKAVRHAKKINIAPNFTQQIAEKVIDIYKEIYPDLNNKSQSIIQAITEEEKTFMQTLERGLKQFEKIAANKENKGSISGQEAFDLYQSYGFPLEITQELARERNLIVEKGEFEKAFEKHQKLSRSAAKGLFKGGLAEAGKDTTHLHTATHLLNEALRQVTGNNSIAQKGSNITPERLRFDFNFDRKISPEELKNVEKLVNEKIKANLPVCFKEMSLEQAKQLGAQAQFGEKYGNRVKVYIIGDTNNPFSKEVCGGPHANSTGDLGQFKIIKEEAVGKGVRRIKASLTNPTSD